MKFYEWAIQGIKASAGKELDSITFCHIPLPEYLNLWNMRNDDGIDVEGGLREHASAVLLGGTGGVSSARPHYNQMEGAANNVFRTLAENGSVAMFVGHDHVNNFRGLYSEYDEDTDTTWEMFLSYGRGSGSSTYPYLSESSWLGRIAGKLFPGDPVYSLDYERAVMFINLNTLTGGFTLQEYPNFYEWHEEGCC